MGVIKTFSEFINESIWSDMQDRSAGDTVRQEDMITTNEELKNRIQELYKEQGEGDTLDVSSLTDLIKCDDFSNLFRRFYKVERIIGLEDWDVSEVTNMRGMFRDCRKFNSDLSKWDVSNVENMREMFWDCQTFNSDLSNWNVRSVGNMSGMFYNCKTFNSDLSNWDVSSAKYMGCMFHSCDNFNSDLSNWDVSSVEDMECMFYNCKTFNSDLSKWDVSGVKKIGGVKKMGSMFYKCQSLKQIPSWYYTHS